MSQSTLAPKSDLSSGHTPGIIGRRRQDFHQICPEQVFPGSLAEKACFYLSDTHLSKTPLQLQGPIEMPFVTCQSGLNFQQANSGQYLQNLRDLVSNWFVFVSDPKVESLCVLIEPRRPQIGARDNQPSQSRCVRFLRDASMWTIPCKLLPHCDDQQSHSQTVFTCHWEGMKGRKRGQLNGMALLSHSLLPF